MIDWNLIALKAGFQLLPWQIAILRRMEAADETGRTLILSHPRRAGLSTVGKVWRAAHPEPTKGHSITEAYVDEVTLMPEPHVHYALSPSIAETSERNMHLKELGQLKQRITHQRRELRRLNQTIRLLQARIRYDDKDTQVLSGIIDDQERTITSLRLENSRLRKELADSRPWWWLW